MDRVESGGASWIEPATRSCVPTLSSEPHSGHRASAESEKVDGSLVRGAEHPGSAVVDPWFGARVIIRKRTREGGQELWTPGCKAGHARAWSSWDHGPRGITPRYGAEDTAACRASRPGVHHASPWHPPDPTRASIPSYSRAHRGAAACAPDLATARSTRHIRAPRMMSSYQHGSHGTERFAPWSELQGARVVSSSRQGVAHMDPRHCADPVMSPTDGHHGHARIPRRPPMVRPSH
jgi:hypothetical protein